MPAENSPSESITPNVGQQDPNRIDASPTKEFFVFMITRDIDLSRAIADLVDNCVDGAKRLRPTGDYSGLCVKVNISPTEFRIADNCGGMDVDLARNYAFRFGRAPGMPGTPHSIGQFGVGMKRALFKIGDTFEIESKTSTSRFVVRETLTTWIRKLEWDFHFAELEEGVPQQEPGTKITVTALFKGISDEFALQNFENRLRLLLSSAHQQSIGKGLVLTLNGVPLTFTPTALLISTLLTPARRDFAVPFDERRKIDVRLIAGVGQSEPASAGWNVFCNGRLILQADKSRITGWGDSNPHYHNEYARFRGFAFFDADDASTLPWNTTKSAVDEDSPQYRAVRLEMIQMMTPVIRYLSAIAKEKKQQENDDPTPSEAPLLLAQATQADSVVLNANFRAPVSPPAVTPVATAERISYIKPKAEIEKVKKELGARTAKEVGEKTFDYYMRMECD